MVNHIRGRLWIAGALLAVYWLTLFTLTHLPLVKGVGTSDKLLHFAAYFGLAVLLGWVWHGGARPRLLHYAAILVVIALYGVFDELTQSLVGRSTEFYDWLADMAGASCGLVFHRVAMLFFHWTSARPVSVSDEQNPAT